jgi:hypothetical protein
MNFENFVTLELEPVPCEHCGDLTQRESIEEKTRATYYACSDECLLVLVNIDFDGAYRMSKPGDPGD